MTRFEHNASISLYVLRPVSRAMLRPIYGGRIWVVIGTHSHAVPDVVQYRCAHKFYLETNDKRALFMSVKISLREGAQKQPLEGNYTNKFSHKNAQI